MRLDSSVKSMRELFEPRDTHLGNAVALVLIALWSIVRSAPTHASASELRPFEAAYAWHWHGVTVAVSTLKLERQGSTWIYLSKSEPRGIGRLSSQRPWQQSTLQETHTGIRPLNYEATDGTNSPQHQSHVVFDWPSGRATGIYEGVSVDLPLQTGVQDDLSVQIALMSDLIAGRTPTTFRLIDKNTVFEYQYSSVGHAELKTDLGTVQTVIYQSRKRGSDRVTWLWCAPSLGYVPMRIEQSKDSDVQWSMQIQSLKRL